MSIFMKVPFTQGSVTAAEYRDWILLDSFQLSVNRNISMEQGASGKRGLPSFSGFTVTKKTDDSSAGFFTEIVNGLDAHNVEIVMVDTNGDKLKEIVRYKLRGTVVASYSVSGDDRGYPHESLTLSYTFIEVAFTPQDKQKYGKAPIRASYQLS